MKWQTIAMVLFSLVAVVALFAVVYFGGQSLVPGIASDIDQNGTSQASKIAGDRAPYFDLPDLEGNHHKLSDSDNSPVVIVFWTTWDDRATDQIKILDDYLHTSNNLVKFVAIDSQEDKSVVASFIKRGGYAIPTLLDGFGATSEEYHIKSVPTFVFVDGSGMVQEVYAGVLSAKLIGDKVENLLH